MLSGNFLSFSPLLGSVRVCFKRLLLVGADLLSSHLRLTEGRSLLSGHVFRATIDGHVRCHTADRHKHLAVFQSQRSAVELTSLFSNDEICYYHVFTFSSVTCESCLHTFVPSIEIANLGG